MLQQKMIKIALASGEVKEFAFSMSKSEPYFLNDRPRSQITA